MTTEAVELLDVERRIALFAQAITGAAYEIRATQTFTGTAGGARDDGAMLSSNALYLPPRIATNADQRTNRRTFRLLTLHQLGYREFGTFEFRIASAHERSPMLAARARTGAVVRASDLEAFYDHFAVPGVSQTLFGLIEAYRIDRRMIAAYPGVRGDHRREAAAERGRRRPLDRVADLRDIFEAVLHFTLGTPRSDLIRCDATGLLEPILTLTAAAHDASADVYTTADSVSGIYALLDSRGLLPAITGSVVLDADAAQLTIERPAMHGKPPLEWLQREDRLDDWSEDLEGLDATIATSAIDAQAPIGESGAQRPPDIDVRRVTDERDTLARRIDIERNIIRHALGDDGKPVGVSFLYDEWDCHAARYLPGWCRLYERRAESGEASAVVDLLKRIAPHEPRVRRQFRQLPLQAYQRTRRVLDGEELDWDQVIDHQIELKRGGSPDDRVYQRRDRATRDVAAAFLIDLSASTDDAVLRNDAASEPPPTKSTSAADDEDPFLWQPSRVAPDVVPPRRIIDVLRDSIALMARALDSHGDAYGVYGFSGYGRDCVEYYVAKEFVEPLRGTSLKALVGMRPRRSTRMGPAIRHSTVKLARTGSALKVLIMLSDGFPQDCDYGPDRSDHAYGVADTARALEEAARAGIQTFCVTVDRSGHDYLKRMCPDDRYLVIEDIEALPDALSKVYQKLTG